jgi:hypothetical protein
MHTPTKRRAQTQNEQPMVQVGPHMVPIFGQLDNNELAVVDLNTLMRLAALLQQADIRKILATHRERIAMLDEGLYKGHVEMENGMEAFTEILSSELRFHQTINQITLYRDEENIIEQFLRSED